MMSRLTISKYAELEGMITEVLTMSTAASDDGMR